MYQSIECTLYEIDQKNKIEISKYHYDEKTPITLDEFLKKVEFKIKDYSNSCKVYEKNSLYLEINAKDEEEKITTYQIPLQLEDDCSKTQP